MPTEKELLALCLRFIENPQVDAFDRAMLLEAIKAKLEPQRPWRGLTEDDIAGILEDKTILGLYGMCYAVEKVLKEKNA